MSFRVLCGLAAIVASPNLGAADPLNLGAYLESVSGVEISFDGEISFDERHKIFRLKDSEGNWFRANIDAGADIRRGIEQACAEPPIFSSSDVPCTMQGVGTVFIDGSAISVSVEEVTSSSW